MVSVAANDNAPPPVAAAPEPEPVVEPPAAEAPQEQTAAEAPQERPATEAPTEVAAASEAAPTEAEAVATESAEATTTEAAPEASAVEAAPEAAAEPALVEVWRPGGRSEERRPRHDRSRHRHHKVEGTQAASADGTAETGEGAKPERHRRGLRHNEFRKPREGAPGEAAAAPAEGAPAPAREPREDRPPRRERFEGKDKERDGRRDKPQGDRKDRGERDRGREFGGKGGRDKRDSGPSHRQYATSAAPRERDRPADPNSPFAKLAALKEQLARKE